MATIVDPEPRELDIGLDKLGFIMTEARRFDAKVAPVEEDRGGNPADHGEREVLIDSGDDAVLAELSSFLATLNQDEKATVLALAWLGRGEYAAEEWDDLLQQAYASLNERTPAYLTGLPLLGDYIEEGLSMLGYAMEDLEAGRGPM